MHPIKVVISLGAAMMLQGCVAAAFPIAAGGLLGERTLAGSEDRSRDQDPVVEVAVTEAREVSPNSGNAPVEGEPFVAENSATSGGAFVNDGVISPAAVPAAVPETPDEVASAENSRAASVENAEPVFASTVAAAPADDVVRPLPSPVPTTREPYELSGINQLLSYANQRQVSSAELPKAAMLSSRISLEPTKARCGGVAPTVLIDLDPEDGLFDPSSAKRPPSGLALGLARLRLNGVSVAWISGNGVDELDAINRSLALSGLDINNEDRVLLVRNTDDRKQILREELAQISCLIAIAGDTRSDFDELYDYLKNPADAETLEPMIGDGWFLIPQPLL